MTNLFFVLYSICESALAVCRGMEAETDVVGGPVAVVIAEDWLKQGDGVGERGGAIV